MIRLAPARIRDERGMTLIEVLITMGLMLVVSSLMTTVVITVNRVVRRTDDENRGLTDAKVVSERLARDLRDARGIATGADQNHLVIWIDYNSDYLQQTNETVRWELKESTDSPGHYDVLRQVSGETEVVEARSLVSDIAFTYSPAVPATNLVTVSMTYDALVGVGSKERRVTFSTRLRNVR